MKRYFVLSFIVHILPLIVILLVKPMTITDQQTQQEQQAQNKNKGEQNQRVEIEVIEQVPTLGAEEPKKELKKFYWGIGIAVDHTYMNMDGYVTPVPVTIVEKVYAGYCAESAGILPGDKIVLVNNQYITGENDIIGNGPREMVLTIVRNDRIIQVPINRCKVYY